MRKFITATRATLGFGIFVCAAAPAFAGPLDSPGAQKAMVCSACHGPAGNSPNRTVPALAGMDRALFKQKVQDFAEGKRQSPEMEPYSKYIIEIGLDDIADYFASQKMTAPAKGKIIAKQ